MNKTDERHVRVVQVCELDELVSKDENVDTEGPFCFIYNIVH